MKLSLSGKTLTKATNPTTWANSACLMQEAELMDDIDRIHISGSGSLHLQKRCGGTSILCEHALFTHNTHTPHTPPATQTHTQQLLLLLASQLLELVPNRFSWLLLLKIPFMAGTHTHAPNTPTTHPTTSLSIKDEKWSKYDVIEMKMKMKNDMDWRWKMTHFIFSSLEPLQKTMTRKKLPIHDHILHHSINEWTQTQFQRRYYTNWHTYNSHLLLVCSLAKYIFWGEQGFCALKTYNFQVRKSQETSGKVR